jgi:hypothetical protein
MGSEQHLTPLVDVGAWKTLTMKMNGWEQLLCDYFSSICISELSEPLAMDDFKVARTESDGAVIFKRFDVFIEVGYEVESAPNYSLTVVIGFGDRKYAETGKLSGVPLWFLIRDDEPARRYSFWKFSTESQLRKVLVRIKNEVIDIHVRPLWQRTEVLEDALSDFNARVG